MPLNKITKILISLNLVGFLIKIFCKLDFLLQTITKTLFYSILIIIVIIIITE